MTWSKTPEQMGIQPCERCGEDTSSGGKFVNRFLLDDNYLCEECFLEMDHDLSDEMSSGYSCPIE
jgi:hypothetical protein